MKKLKLALMGVCLAWTAQAAYADDCYSDSLMAYVDSRIPSGNQVERRWEKIKAALLEQDGGITLERAEEILANRKARGFGLEHMDEVVAALKCLAAQPDPEPEVVIVPPQPEDPPQPLNSDPKPQQASVTQNFKVYWHGGTAPTSNVDWRISENDHWESDIIVRLERPLDMGVNGPKFCVLNYAYEGPNHWQRGHVRLSGMAAFGGGNSCTAASSGSDYVTHGTIPGGHWAEYRGRIMVRDNNVLEKDLDIGRIVFGFASGGTSPDRYADTYGNTNNVTTTHHVPTTTTTVQVLNPNHVPPSSGQGWIWQLDTRGRTSPNFVESSETCGEDSVRAAHEALESGPVIACDGNGNTCRYPLGTWVPLKEFTGCRTYTDIAVANPVTSAETINHADNRLPVVEDDEVAYLNIRKQSGKWTYSASKPIVQRNNNNKCSYGHLGDTHWTEREDAVYLKVKSGGDDHFIEFPAGDVSGQSIADAKVVFCTRFSPTRDRDYSLGTVRDQCALSNSPLKQSVVLESIWVGGWGEIKLSNNDQIVFEQAGKTVNLCN